MKVFFSIVVFWFLFICVVGASDNEKPKVIRSQSTTYGIQLPSGSIAVPGTASMTLPEVKHEKHVTSQEYTVTTRTCPAGYEGHYVDVLQGFVDQTSTPTITFSGPVTSGTIYSVTSSFTICFQKDFMDNVRKHPELQVYRSNPNVSW